MNILFAVCDIYWFVWVHPPPRPIFYFRVGIAFVMINFFKGEGDFLIYEESFEINILVHIFG